MIRWQYFIIPLLVLIIVGCSGLPPAASLPQSGPATSANVVLETAPSSEEVVTTPTEVASVAVQTDIVEVANAVAVNVNQEAAQPTVADDVAASDGPVEVADTAAMTAAQPTTDCPATDFLEVQTHPANAAYSVPELSVTCEGERVIIRSNGIPNFEFTQVTPNDLALQNYQWEIPRTPTPAAQPSDIPLLGPVAVAVNGIPIFGPNEAQPTWGDPYLDQILDYCNGHTAQRGMYHFHARPDCLFEDVAGTPGLVIGYAFDGYPILAPYICLDAACNEVKEVQSSWQRTQNVAAAWEAHEYVAGSGDLDRCNGLTLADGRYAYFATDTFPYFLGCYHGTAAGNGFGAPGGGPGGPPQGNDQQRGGLSGGQSGPPSGQGFGPPANSQNFSPPSGGPPDLAAAAAQLGISEQTLREALGPPPPNLADTAQALGISEQALIDALGLPPRGGPSRGGN